jgi:hypothetical protein
MADEETMLTSPGPPDYSEQDPDDKSSKGDSAVWDFQSRIGHHMKNLERVISITWLTVRTL